MVILCKFPSSGMKEINFEICNKGKTLSFSYFYRIVKLGCQFQNICNIYSIYQLMFGIGFVCLFFLGIMLGIGVVCYFGELCWALGLSVCLLVG